MSDEALAPTLSNFDAIVAAKSAALDKAPADDAPDTQEYEASGEPDDLPPEEVDDEEPESPSEDDTGDEEEAEPEEQDDQAAEPVEQALRAPFKAFRESLKAKRVTPELMKALGDLELEVETVNGPARLRLSEMGGHVMREARFSREMAKTKEAQAKAQQLVQIEQARTNSWRQNPAELEQGLEIMGCTPALERVFYKWAQEKYNYLNATPEQREQIDYMRQMTRQRAQERMRNAQLERELMQLKQQSAPEFDEPTRQAGDFISKNLDGTLGAALKEAGAGRINNDLRLAFTNELSELGQEGVPLELAMKEAARTVAAKQRRLLDLAKAQNQQERSKKPEVSGRRAPAGNAPPKREGDGRFQAPTRTNGKRSKVLPTAAAFGERFGV